MRRPWLSLLILALPLVGGSVQAAEPFDPFNQAKIDDRPGAVAPMQASFRDEAGRTVTLASLAGGKPLVVAFVQHHCPNLCGASLEGLAQAASRQADGGFSIAALSIDPRETPADAQASLEHLSKANAPIHGLVGDQATVGRVASALGYHFAWDPRFQQYAHISADAVLSPKGRLAGWIYGLDPPPQVLTTALNAARSGGFASVGEKLLLLCYHYDPQKGRYDPLYWTLIRVSAGLAVLILAASIGVAILRERRA